MNDKYHITSDGSIFEIQPDGSLKKLGSVADGAIKSYEESNKTNQKVGTLTVLYDGEWVIIDGKYELHYNGKHIMDFSFKKPFRQDLPLEQPTVLLKVKKWFLSYSFKFTLDPTKDYYCRLTYSRMGKQFNLSVYDENNKRVWKDTLF